MWPLCCREPDALMSVATSPTGAEAVRPQFVGALLASGQPVSESAAVPVMPSELTVCCGEGRSMLSV
jgi:hypothetical protein